MPPAQTSNMSASEEKQCPHRQLFMGVRTTGPINCKWSLNDHSVADPHNHQQYKCVVMDGVVGCTSRTCAGRLWRVGWLYVGR